MVIIKDKYGRLGNQLFRFAHFIAFSKENQIHISFPGFDDYAKYFLGTKNNLFCSYPAISLPFCIPNLVRRIIFRLVPLLKRIFSRLDPQHRWYNHLKILQDQNIDLDEIKNIKTLGKYCIITLEGWLYRGNESFIKHSAFICSYFTPINKYTLPINKLFISIKKPHDIIIGLHIRRGDFKDPKNERLRDYLSFHDYKILINKTINYFNNYNPGLVICSDDEIPKEIYSDYHVYYTDGHLISDIYALSKCDYILGVASTFSLWASFYGKVPYCVINDKNQEITLESFNIVTH